MGRKRVLLVRRRVAEAGWRRTSQKSDVLSRCHRVNDSSLPPFASSSAASRDAHLASVARGGI